LRRKHGRWQTLGVGFYVMAAAVIAAIDQHIANAGCAHFAEGDFWV
jgi:hypothetical protein